MTMPWWGVAGMAIFVLYGLQAELRFGKTARGRIPVASDRGSSRVLTWAAMVPIAGFVLAMKADTPWYASWLPGWFRAAVFPGMPAAAWTGVVIGALGLGLRLWSVLTLRERYTRTLLMQERHTLSRRGPYRFVRHPGYLGSLLALNGAAMASGNAVVLAASLAATGASYAYRVRVEDAMLVAAFGEPYERYRREVGALLPFRRAGAPLLAVAMATAGATAVHDARLAPGTPLPPLQAKTLSGETVSLPGGARERGLVLVVGFSKAAAKVTKPWLDACRASSAAACYDVRMIEEVPSMFRGMMEHGMKSGLPPELQRQVLLVDTDNDAWRQRLGATDDKSAYILACDGEGVVRALASGTYKDAELKKVLGAMAPHGGGA